MRLCPYAVVSKYVYATIVCLHYACFSRILCFMLLLVCLILILKGIPRSKHRLISYERASKNMKNAFYFMQKS